MRSRAIGFVAAVLMCGATVRHALADPVPVVFPVTITASTLAILVKPYRFTFALYDAAAGGTRLWSESKSYKLPPSKRITHQLGSVSPATNPISPLLFDRQLWVEASAAGKIFPRVKLTVVPYAVRSELAGNIEGQVTAGQVDATGADSGDVLTANGDGAASWQPPATGGTVTAVAAGAGLTGGTITTSGELAVDTGAIQARVGGTCAEGSSIRSIAADGTVVCEPDDAGGGSGTVTQVDTGTGLTGGPIRGEGTIAIDTAVVPRLGASNTFTGTQAVLAGGPDLAALVVQGAPGQYEDLQQWRNSDDKPVALLSPEGLLSANGFSGSGAGLTGVNAATLGGQAASAFAGAAHAHSGAEITSGTVATTRLNMGTAAGTVAAGDHGHDATYVNEGQANAVTSAMIAAGAVTDAKISGQIDGTKLGSHQHAGEEITSGTVGFSRLPAGSGAAQVAVGNHVHDDRYYTRAHSDLMGQVYVASIGAAAIGPNTEANAHQYMIKGTPNPGQYLVRLDAELNTYGALWFIYNCKLQYRMYPAALGAPFLDLAGTRRTVSWRLGQDSSGVGVPVSISAQAPVTAGDFGLDVRLVCWGEWDILDGSPPPLVDYGWGFNSGVLTLQAVSAVY